MKNLNKLNKEAKEARKPLVFLFIVGLSVLSALFIFIISPAQACDAQMKETLVRIINQLQNIKPLISKAQREQSENPRIKVHFDRFKGVDGKWHNGLRQDIDSIQQALIRIVNQESVEPRNFNPINDDFIDQ